MNKIITENISLYKKIDNIINLLFFFIKKILYAKKNHS